MSFEGQVQNGVVVLDNGPQLPDGTRVEVIVREPESSGLVGSAPAGHNRSILSLGRTT